MGNGSATKRGWTREPPRAALHVEKVIDRFSGFEAIGSIAHPGHPWIAKEADPLDKIWREQAGWDYLCAVARAAALEPGKGGWIDRRLWDRLNPESARDRAQQTPAFGWLDLTWGRRPGKSRGPLPYRVGPLGSIQVHRRNGQRVVVLLAGNVDTLFQLQFGADLGLRIVMHVVGSVVRIYGVTLASLCTDRALRAAPSLIDKLSEGEVLRPIKEAIAKALVTGPVLDGGEVAKRAAVWIHNIERSTDTGAAPDQLSVSGLAAQTKPCGGPLVRRRVHDFRVQVVFDGTLANVVHVSRNDYIGSNAAPRHDTQQESPVRAFVQDGASQRAPGSISQRRPTRTAEVLEGLRANVDLEFDLVGKAGDRLLRFGGRRAPLFETHTSDPSLERNSTPQTVSAMRQGPVVLPSAALRLGSATKARQPKAAVPPILSDAQGSIETHARATELFFRLGQYGFEAQAYFRFARLPLVQRARPSMTWAPDGDLPNAEVRPFIGAASGRRGKKSAGPLLRDRVQLLVRYGSASPFHRHMGEVVDARSRGSGGATLRHKSQYLSIACDSRWAWHEFGHVLTYAGTGELELPFAHGVGDALAAIVTDPDSKLVEDAESPARFITYPWIEVPGRSHGRRADSHGYCWCGARNLVRLNFSGPIERYHHGYFGEQLLSSSLFRLYRSLGGDTRGNRATAEEDLAQRLEASEYCVYLVMYALSLLGPDSIAPAQTAHQFVAALIEADLGTGDWRVEPTWPMSEGASKAIEQRRAAKLPRGSATLQRRGGLAHKVIRWAFERQGLYATDEPKTVVEGVGLPPEVDIYIADRRPPDGPGDAGGGYAPVPLHFEADAQWLADAAAVSRQGDRLIVQVRNRGHASRPAAEVSVRAWVRTTSDGDWIALVSVKPSPDGVAPVVDATRFEFDLASAADRPSLWILACADAPEDPSNLPGKMPPPTDTDELRTLVAQDNNLALAIWGPIAT